MYACNSTTVCQLHDCLCFRGITYGRRCKASRRSVVIQTEFVSAIGRDNLALKRAGVVTSAIEDEDPGSAAVGGCRGVELQ